MTTAVMTSPGGNEKRLRLGIDFTPGVEPGTLDVSRVEHPDDAASTLVAMLFMRSMMGFPIRKPNAWSPDGAMAHVHVARTIQYRCKFGVVAKF